jgi:hypothetical protein
VQREVFQSGIEGINKVYDAADNPIEPITMTVTVKE